MRRLKKLPPAFKRHRKVGGAFIFAAFDEADDGEETAIAAIRELFGDAIDEAALRAIGHREIGVAEFLGEHCDPESRTLIKRGTWRTTDGKELVDPPLKKMDGVRPVSGSYGLPDPGEGGEFAHGFAFTPYSLTARPSEIQAMFEEVLAFLLPQDEPHRILDWTSPKLGDVSPWFAPGLEWWGVYLFTIYQPERGRLIALAASTTD